AAPDAPALDRRALATRALADLPPIPLQNAMNPLAVHCFAQLAPNEHRQPTQPIFRIRRDQPADKLDEIAIEFGRPPPFSPVVEGRPWYAEPPAELRDGHHLPLRAHLALHRQKVVSGFPDRAANFFRASSSSTSSPIFARSSRTSASCSACSSSARAFRLRSPPFTNVSIHVSTSDCLRSCSRHTSTSFFSPRISSSSSSTFRFAVHRWIVGSISSSPGLGRCTLSSPRGEPSHGGAT